MRVLRGYANAGALPAGLPDGTVAQVAGTDWYHLVAGVWTLVPLVIPGGPTRPAVLGTEQIIWRCNDAASPILNSGIGGAAGNLAATGANVRYGAPMPTGSSVRLIGDGSYLSGGAAVDPGGAPTVSFSMWLSPCTNAAMMFLGKGTMVSISQLVGGRVQAVLTTNTPSTRTLTSTYLLDAGGPHHVVVTYDVATMYLYVDGALEASGALVGALTGGAGSVWTVGIFSDFLSLPANARFGEIRMDPAAPSAAAIAAQFRAGVGYVL